MISPPAAVRRHPRVDPVSVTAWLVLAATGLAALVFSALDTPPAARAPVPPPPGPGSAADAGPACPRSGIVVSVGRANAAMGLRVLAVRLTVCGGSPYTVNGRPGVRVLTSTGAPIDVDMVSVRSISMALEHVDAVPGAVTLRPGESAEALLAWRNTVTAGASPPRGARLEIAARSGAASQTVQPETEIDLGSPARLGVGPWTRADIG